MPATLAPSWRHRRESLPPPSPQRLSPRPCVPAAAPHPGAAANADSAGKTNCSDSPRDALADIVPTATAGSDADVAAAAHASLSSPVAAAAVPLAPPPVGSQTACFPVSSLQAFRQRPTDSRYSRPFQIVVDLASPIPQLRAIWRCPKPNSNRNRRTSLVFRMDFLRPAPDLLYLWIYGLSMPGDCPASLCPFLRGSPCGKHSVPRRTPCRYTTKLFASHRNRRSPSDRNAVRNHNGMVFAFRPESRSPSTGFPNSARSTLCFKPV